VDEHHPLLSQPIACRDREPAELPGPIVEQEVLDRADLPVARLNLATDETTHGEQHGPVPPTL
jgi:hypothetical protein